MNREDLSLALSAIILDHYVLEHRGEENYIGAVPIWPDVRRRYTDLAERLAIEYGEFSGRFSAEDIAERLRSLITTTIRSGYVERVPVLTENLWMRLQESDERKVCFVPLAGIEMSDPVINIGDLTLRQMDADGLRYVKDLWFASIDRTSNTDDQKAASKAYFERDFADNLRDGICVQVNVCADLTTAERLAHEESLILIDLLRYTIPALYQKDLNIRIGLKGDGVPSLYRRYILPLGESDGRINQFRTGPFGSYLLDDRARAAMDRLGVFNIAERIGRSMSPELCTRVTWPGS